MKTGLTTVLVKTALPVRAMVVLALAGMVTGCVSDVLTPHEESHCRSALDTLGKWTGETGDPTIVNTYSSTRTVDGKQVRIVNISYRQGGTGRLITCTYDVSGKGPVLDVIYKNVHLTDDDLKRLNAAVK
jgi:hypothetical protein